LAPGRVRAPPGRGGHEAKYPGFPDKKILKNKWSRGKEAFTRFADAFDPQGAA
jgi:hypothetical protein